jgi:DNA processing protein
VIAGLRRGEGPAEVLARLAALPRSDASSRAAKIPGSAGAGGLVGPGWAASADPVPGYVDRLTQLGVRVLPVGHPGYPEGLAALEDAPPVLLVRGCVQALAAPAVAIVGARAATRGGRAQARRIARELAGRGLTIVSGLARGIDAEAHRGALEAGGRTVAVLACGLDRTYPPEHRELASEIAVDGAVLSEMPLGTPPRRELFPLRNRIISGASLGIIVVEARRRSGSLITVRHAANQGREVWVVPGAVEGPFAEGSNRLLREGARAIQSAADVIEDLAARWAGGADRSPAVEAPAEGTHVVATPPPLDSPLAHAPDPETLEGRILEQLIESGPATREELMIRVEPDSGRLAKALLDLELGERIVEERDGRFHARWG